MTTSEITPVVEAVEIDKFFGGVRALKSASIAFLPGEVHSLAGENGSGKSTLIKIISGVETPSAGSIRVAGKEFSHLTPRQSRGLGVEVIYQDFSLLPNLTAAENIALPVLAQAGRTLWRPKRVLEIAERAVASAGIRLELHRPVGSLTVADRQLCAIARALAQESRFLAMDEPTTALTWREVDALLGTVGALKERGVAIAFVSHKLQEVFSVADRVSVIRNGTIVESGVPGDYSHESLTEGMTGRRSVSFARTRINDSDSAPALSVTGLSAPPLFADIDLHISAGEIVGLSGLLGSGRTEVAEAIAGVRPARSGRIRVRGRVVRIRSVADAVSAGIGYVPEDRLTQGLFLDQPIADNIAAVELSAFARFGILSRRRLERAANRIVAALRIKVGAIANPVRSLSGGNAQRVLIGKWLLGEPAVVLLNGPTVGVDVGSKFDILGMLHAQSLQGLGVLVISDDIPELIATCHRVLVMRNGRIVDELVGTRLTEDELIRTATA